MHAKASGFWASDEGAVRKRVKINSIGAQQTRLRQTNMFTIKYGKAEDGP